MKRKYLKVSGLPLRAMFANQKQFFRLALLFCYKFDIETLIVKSCRLQITKKRVLQTRIYNFWL